MLPPVNEMLFETRDLSATLMVFCIQIFWLSLILTMTSLLQGLGKVVLPAFLLIIGLVLKWLCNAWLLPKMGIMGAAIASNVGFAFIAISLYVYVYSIWKIRFANARFYGHLAVASLLMICQRIDVDVL